MQHTTHGLMTPADLADHQQLTDTNPHPDCPRHEDEDGNPTRCMAVDDCPGNTGLYPGCPGHYSDPGPIVHCSIADDCPEALDFYAPRITATGETMDAHTRASNYINQQHGGRITARQRRRLVKKAARTGEPVYRYDGMGYPPAMRGFKYLMTDVAPVSGIPA